MFEEVSVSYKNYYVLPCLSRVARRSFREQIHRVAGAGQLHVFIGEAHLLQQRAQDSTNPE